MSNIEVLPTTWDEGLTPSAVTKVNTLCSTINNETGQYFKSMVSKIVEIRQTLKEDKNWLVFCSSGQLPFSSRQIRDLVQANEWLSSTGVSDGVLGQLSTRTIARIGGIQNDEVMNEIESRLMDGEVMSYQKVMDCIGLIKPDKKVKLMTEEQKRFAEASKKEVFEWYQQKSEEVKEVSSKVDDLTAMVETLRMENERLNQMVNLFEKLANQSTDTRVEKVMVNTKAVNGSTVGAV